MCSLCIRGEDEAPPGRRAAYPREKGREFSRGVAWAGLDLAQSERRERTKPISEK